MKKLFKLLAFAVAVVLVASVFGACSLASPGKKLIGTWLDSTGVHGYEFKEDGKVMINVFDASKLNAVGGIIDSLLGEKAGSIEGVYTVAKGEDKLNHLTLNYNILGSTRTMEYTFTIDKSALTLVNVSDGSSTTYIRQTAPVTTSAAAAQ